MSAISLPKVPEGLRDLMKAYTQEVLREKPINLLEFSSNYFENIAAIRTRHNKAQYESLQSYEITMKNRIRQLVPLSLVYQIIPEHLTNIVKNFIKAVLKENPDNLLVFANQYFKNLRIDSACIDYTKYTAYEKYSEINSRKSFESKMTCACGRLQVMKPSFEVDQHDSKSVALDKPNYFKAAYIIQKHYRNYLKRKAEKSRQVNVPKEIHSSQVYLNAIILIQRQIRRYLSQKRAKNTTKLTNKTLKKFNSEKYIKAIYIIQRQCRQYLSKKKLQQPLKKGLTLPLDSNVSLVTAALIIQRAFRRMVKSEKYKKHAQAELGQSDEINDNASEAASYTSASTALLSTESTCEPNEYVSNNYEEGVHQQTIKEDEEVENDNKNRRNENVSEDIKSIEKSIFSDENELCTHSTNQEYTDLGVTVNTKNDENIFGILSQSQSQDEQCNSIGKSIKFQSLLPTQDVYEKSISEDHNFDLANTNINNRTEQILSELKNKPQNISLCDADEVTLKHDSLEMQDEQALTSAQDGLLIQKSFETNKDAIDSKSGLNKQEDQKQKNIAPSSNPSNISCTETQDALQVEQSKRNEKEHQISCDSNSAKADNKGSEIENFSENTKSDQGLPRLGFHNVSNADYSGITLMQDSLKVSEDETLKADQNLIGLVTQKFVKTNEDVIDFKRDSMEKTEDERQKNTTASLSASEIIPTANEHVLHDEQTDVNILANVNTHDTPENTEIILNENKGIFKNTTSAEEFTNIEAHRAITRDIDEVPLEKQTFTNEQDLTRIIHQQIIEAGDNVSILNSTDSLKENEPMIDSSLKTLDVVSHNQLTDAEDDLDISISSQSDFDSVITNNTNKNLTDTTKDEEEIFNKNKNIPKNIKSEHALTEFKRNSRQDDNAEPLLLISSNIAGEQSLTNKQDSIDDENSLRLLDNSKEEAQKISKSSSNAAETVPNSTQDTLQDLQTQDVSSTEGEHELSLSSQSDIDSVINNSPNKNLTDTTKDAEEIFNENKNILQNIKSEDALTEFQRNSRQDDNAEPLLLISSSIAAEQSLTNKQDSIYDENSLRLLDNSKEEAQKISKSSSNAAETVPSSIQDTLQDQETQDEYSTEGEHELSLSSQSDFYNTANKNECVKLKKAEKIKKENNNILQNITTELEPQDVSKTDEDTASLSISEVQKLTKIKDFNELAISSSVKASEEETIFKNDLIDKLKLEEQNGTAIASNKSDLLDDNYNAVNNTERDLNNPLSIEIVPSTLYEEDIIEKSTESKENEIIIDKSLALTSTISSGDSEVIVKEEQNYDETSKNNLIKQTSENTEKAIQNICEPSDIASDEITNTKRHDLKGDPAEIVLKEAKAEDKLPINNEVVEQDPLIIEKKSSSILSKPLIGEQIITNSTNKSKKLLIAKDKQITSITSGRLINAPIAELQLKSFSSPSDTGPWYEVYDQSQTKNEDSQTKVKSTKNNSDLKQPFKSDKSVASSQEVESMKAAKPKPSVSFFISFDDSDGIANFRPPTKMLGIQKKKNSKNLSKQNNKMYDKQDFSLNSPIGGSNESKVMKADFNYQEFGTQKLHTIQELNENESGNDSRPKIQKAEDNWPVIKSEFTDSETVQDLSQSKETVSDSYKSNPITESFQKDCTKRNVLGYDDKSVRMRSATIIISAFRIYKTRQKNKETTTVAVSEEAKNKDDLSPRGKVMCENIAATKIQKAVRQFLSKNSKNSSKWFVGTQRIELLPNYSKAVGNSLSDDMVAIEPESAKKEHCTVNGENNGLLETNVGTDSENFLNTINLTKIFEKDDETSNNLAGSTNDAGIDFVKGIQAISESESDACLKEGASTREKVKEFLIKEIESSSVREVPCVKMSISLTTLCQDNQDSEINNEEKNNQHDDLKLLGNQLKTERLSSGKVKKLDIEDFYPSEKMVTDDPVVKPISPLQAQSSFDMQDGDVIVFNRLQREETRESSAQSESIIFGNTDDYNIVSNEAEITRTQLSRHYTIAGDDPQSIFKSVTLDETIIFNDNETIDGINEINDGNSFCLDDETSENIRKKIMAYSLSETDSDYYDPNKSITDDFHLDTAMTDDIDTSTETESTIVSAAAKIQAGARGFLTRRRLRRASAGTKSSTQETKASFGNDAISESLERFIEEEAAKKIQSAYRLHNNKKQNKQNLVTKSASYESSLAAKRQTLQRGDALQKYSNSTPEDETIGSKIVDTIFRQQNEKRLREISSTRIKWPARRQNSMPVQIDCEVLRIVPKHVRRRIKSAELGKQQNRFQQ